MKAAVKKYTKKFYNSKFYKNFFALIKKMEFPFRSMMSRLRFGTITFLDTNMVVSNDIKSDNRTKKLNNYFTQYFITDVIKKEISDLENSGLGRIFKYKYKTIGFQKLRELFPSICPIYYNLISWMYNPANIASPEFFLHLMQSLKLRKKKLDKNHENVYMRMMDKLKMGMEKKVDSSGNYKSLLASNIDASVFQYFQKKIKNRDSENLLNDYKNVCIILLFTLINKTNTIFITADRDILAIVITLAESLAQGATFPHLFLQTLTGEDKKKLFSGKRITRFINFKEFKKTYEGTLEDIINPYWQKNFVSLKIRLWDMKKQSFVEDMLINFNDDMREMVLTMHGPLSCPFAKNDTHGNWLHYRFWPPPLKSPNVVKVLLSAKKIINRRNIYVPDYIHQQNCKYAADDKNNRLKKYYSFWC